MLRERRFPSALDLPTGSGKTAAIDIAIYALARAAHDGEPGAFPRRVFLVVDRRVLVDQAWRRGQVVLRAVEQEPELRPLRDALAKLSPEPPASIRLRGACPTDPSWCRSADQVQVVATTVDQLGSRLLLRGYGTSARMRPVHAGVVAQDSLFLPRRGALWLALSSIRCVGWVRSTPCGTSRGGTRSFSSARL